jgi:hypothetical protein
VFPRGTRFDLAGAPNCSASDLALIVDSIGACPERSQAASGRASLFVGAAGNVDVEVHLFVARPGFAIAFATGNGSVLRVVRATIHRNRVTAILPAMPLPGGYEVAVTGMSLKAPARNPQAPRHPHPTDLPHHRLLDIHLRAL